MKKTKKNVSVFLAVILILAFALTGCGGKQSSGTQSDEVINWSFYTSYGPNDGACCEIWPELFEKIKEETGGRLIINTYWSGQHPYNAEDMLRVLEEGSAEMTHFLGGYLSAVEPVLAVDGMPLMFPADSMEAWDVISGLWGNFSQDTNGVLEDILQERWNASMVHMIPASPQRFFTCGYDVDGVGSLKGHKIRTYSPEFAQLVKDMGGTPVSIAFSEVYTGLATNLVDGLITSTVFAESGGFFDYIDTINMWEITQSSDGLMVSLDALNSLPDDVREIFLRIMNESATKPEMLELDKNNETVEKLQQSGVKVLTPTEEQRAEVTEIVKKSVWDPWLKTAGDDGQRALEQIESLKKK